MRTNEQAVSFASAETVRPTANWSGLCLKFVRSCYGIGPKYGRAIDAWNGAKDTSGGEPPTGVPYFWAGQAGSAGHVALTAGHGYIYSTDIKRPGKVDLVPLTLIKDKWNLHPLGWTYDLNGVNVWVPSPIWPPLAGYDRQWTGLTWIYRKHGAPTVTITQPLPPARAGFSRVWTGRTWSYVSAHILHLQHLAGIGAPLSDHELHELHVYLHPNG